jgi:hypothetical protein
MPRSQKASKLSRRRPERSGRNTPKRRWSTRVTETSNALDLEPGVFAHRSPKQIALSLKRSATRSRRRRAEPFRSAMSLLNFYINRAGRKLSPARKRVMNRAKVKLRKVFGRVAPRTG